MEDKDEFPSETTLSEDTEQGLIKVHSCLTNLPVFLDTSFNKDKQLYVFYFDLSRGFDKVPHKDWCCSLTLARARRIS